MAALIRAMSPAPRTPRRVLVTLLTALLTGCAITAPRTELQERVGRSDLDVGTLRIRVRDLARRLPGMLEVLAEDIATHTDSAPVRRAMLEFKTNAVPTLQAALFQPDPVAALVDAWALVAQLQDLLPKRAAGVSPEVLARARDGLRQVEAELEAQWKELADTDDLSQVRERVHQWASEHPLEGHAYARESTVSLLAGLTDQSQQRLTRRAATLMEDTRDLTARLDLYAGSLPRQARWQAELAATQMFSSALDAPALRTALGELDRTVDILDRFGGLAANTPALVARERAAVLDALERERLALQGFVSSERQAVLASVGQERAAVVEALRAERVATLQQVDGLAGGWVDHAFERATHLVDRVFLWLLGLALLMLVGGLLIAAVVTRAWRASRKIAP